jgi:hypothetical protein
VTQKPGLEFVLALSATYPAPFRKAHQVPILSHTRVFYAYSSFSGTFLRPRNVIARTKESISDEIFFRREAANRDLMLGFGNQFHPTNLFAGCSRRRAPVGSFVQPQMPVMPYGLAAPAGRPPRLCHGCFAGTASPFRFWQWNRIRWRLFEESQRPSTTS